MPRWTIQYQDREAGVIEGVATTKLLRFKDDFIIRLSGSGDADTVVDMRSKSRFVIHHSYQKETLFSLDMIPPQAPYRAVTNCNIFF